MRYIVVQQENKEPIVLLWVKSQRPIQKTGTIHTQHT